MFSLVRSALLAAILITLSACASFQQQNDAPQAAYFDSAYNDHNRAPASYTPPSQAGDQSANVDPLSMRTQADYNFSLGEAYSLDGDHKQAVEAFKTTLIYDQNSPAVNMRLAAEYLKLGMMSDALTQAEEAVSKDPKNVDSLLLLGGLYSSMKLFPKALEQYNAVLKLDPKNMDAPLYIGAVYSEQKQYDKAVHYFESLVKNPEYATPHLIYYYIGRVRADQPEKKYQAVAEQSFKRALKEKPDFVDGVMALGSFYSKKGDKKAAMDLYKQFQKDNGPQGRIAEILAQNYIEAEDYESAYEQLEYIENSGDDALNVKMKMALILIEQKKYPKAISKLEDILKDAPDSDKVRFYLAAVYEESKQDEKAIVQFKKIPAVSQYFAEASVHAAYLLKSSGQLNEAVSLMEKALKERNDQPQMHAMYSSLLDDKGDYKKAVEFLSNAIEKFPTNAQLRFYFGTMNDRLGKKDVVVSEMKKVLEIDPNHVQGMNYLAFTYAEQGHNLEDAEKLARRALHLEPQDGYILDTLGWILLKQGKVTESIKTLETAFKYQSSVSIIAEHLGDAYYRQALVEKAKKMYKRAVDLETDTKKVEEIRAKLTSIEKQETETPRMPASVKATESH